MFIIHLSQWSCRSPWRLGPAWHPLISCGEALEIIYLTQLTFYRPRSLVNFLQPQRLEMMKVVVFFSLLLAAQVMFSSPVDFQFDLWAQTENSATLVLSSMYLKIKSLSHGSPYTPPYPTYRLVSTNLPTGTSSGSWLLTFQMHTPNYLILEGNGTTHDRFRSIKRKLHGHQSSKR